MLVSLSTCHARPTSHVFRPRFRHTFRGAIKGSYTNPNVLLLESPRACGDLLQSSLQSEHSARDNVSEETIITYTVDISTKTG